MNLQNIRARSHIIKLIRAWFDERGFIEMHTPRLVGLPGQEPHLEPFWTTVSSPSLPAYSPTSLPASLITSPEYAMKRLLAEGLDKIYDLGPCFRNGEPWDGTHDPEFLLLEWYRRDAGVNELMDDCEDLVISVAREFRSSPPQLSRSWRRMTVVQAWLEYAGIELVPLLADREAMAKLVASRGQTVHADDTWDDLYFKIFLTDIEPKLGADQPTFLYRYPASMAALARPSADDPRWADRVELYIGDLELANGFAELSDAVEQRKRFEEERTLRQAQGRKVWDVDEKFLSALPKIGNAAGIAFGVDRLVMLLVSAKSINDILPFPASERFL
jgi:lysyl-tRNA synthetase class 2